MSTVAYRDGVIAADRLVAAGDAYVGEMAKIARNRKGDLAGAVGAAVWVQHFLKWFATGRGNFKQPDGTDDGAGVICHHHGPIEIFECGASFEVAADYYAMGSGAAEARGALFAGADPETAVRAAIAHDAHTGGGVDVRHAKPQKRKK